MKNSFKKLLILFGLTFSLCGLRAQEKILGEGRYQHTESDSLLTLFSNKIYRSFYNPSYMTNVTATASVLKVDIDISGKVPAITLSDSADPIFRKAFSERKKTEDDYVNLTKYAAIKHYTNISLLIAVYFEPNYPNQKKVFSYEELEGLWKFGGKDLTGTMILMSRIFIRVGNSGNM